MENESNWYNDAKLDIKALRNSSKIIFIIIILVSCYSIIRNSNDAEPIILLYIFLSILSSILLWTFFNVVCVIASSLIDIKKDRNKE